MAWEVTSEARRRAGALSWSEPESEPEIEGPLKGYHHETYVISLAAPDPNAERIRWKCREPREGLFWFDRRCFESEEELVGSLRGRVTRVPELIKAKGVRLQRFVEGETLGSRHGAGTAVPGAMVEQIMEVFRELAAIRPWTLALKRRCEPKDRPDDGDSAEFLERLIRFTEVDVYQCHHDEYGGLFEDLGVTEMAFKHLRERVKGVHERPFCLLHADLHRENLILDPTGELWVIDWELAMFGDPLYDLATHLYLMRYPERQQRRVTDLWRETMRGAQKRAVAGIERDLPLLLDYKRAQSVFTDVIRSALTLREAGARAEAAVRQDVLLAATARKLHSVLRRAAAPLGLGAVPSAREVAAALDKWLPVGRPPDREPGTPPGRADAHHRVCVPSSP
ncbi:phosphotransferase [Streptomyces sp. NPDC102467]|uniref:phosphotransferase n=1 Tax=Streptomyces sp. NPDC102467 TaxID=3366179 RepID=UPI0037FBC873